MLCEDKDSICIDFDFFDFIAGKFRVTSICCYLFGPLGGSGLSGEYAQISDSPFFAPSPPGASCSVEDFEDGTLDFGISISGSGVVLAPSALTDSVDFDDGVIDGSGQGGLSWFDNTVSSFTITFPAPVTHAGYVWTDGAGGEMTTFEAFGPGMVSLGTIGPFTVGTAGTGGQTDEDRFFGASDANGIIAIGITQNINGLELDHIQFCNQPSQPTQMVGGEYFTLDTTSLLLAGFQTNLAWLVPVVISATAISTFLVKRKF